MYAQHDALVKHLPGKTFAPSLAESYDIAPDFKSATFKLRQGIKFHDDKPVTTEDVKFTFEKYRGANAGILHEKTDKIETPDERTVKFVFKEPFLDFMTIYGSPSSGAGWIVPKAYYEQVGPNGFKQKPIGAGPYRFVRQQAGTEVEFEAFPEYWRKSPSVKTIIIKGIPETATRLAGLQTGELDVGNQMSGDLLDVIRKDTKLRLAPLKAGTVWLEPMSMDSPDGPMKDVKVRQAISLAIDRKAFNDAEMGGLGAMDYAARRPRMFRAAASFSGVLHPLATPDLWLGLFASYTDDPDAVWGDPREDQANWRRHDPTALLPALDGIPLFVSAGDGRPGPFEDGRGDIDPTEVEVGRETRAFVRRAKALDVPVRSDLYGAGIHDWPYWQRELYRALPLLLGAIR